MVALEHGVVVVEEGERGAERDLHCVVVAGVLEVVADRSHLWGRGMSRCGGVKGGEEEGGRESHEEGENVPGAEQRPGAPLDEDAEGELEHGEGVGEVVEGVGPVAVADCAEKLPQLGVRNVEVIREIEVVERVRREPGAATKGVCGGWGVGIGGPRRPRTEACPPPQLESGHNRGRAATARWRERQQAGWTRGRGRLTRARCRRSRPRPPCPCSPRRGWRGKAAGAGGRGPRRAPFLPRTRGGETPPPPRCCAQGRG